MGDIRFNAGELLNILARANSVTSSSVESDHPISAAVDGHVGKPVVFAGGATESIEADLSPDLYGDFETWSGAVPAGWTADHDGGSGAADAVTFFSGTKSAALDVPGPHPKTARFYIDRVLPAGEEQRFIAQMRTDGLGTARIAVQCLQTRRWLAPGGTWQDAATDVFTSSVSGSWDAKALTATIEDFATTGVDQVTIRQYIYASSTPGVAFVANFDAVHIFPTWDVASFHGHNADASQAVAVYGGDSSPAATLVATGTQPAERPAFYVLASARQTYRYVKILFPAENVEQLHLGEVFFVERVEVEHADPSAHLGGRLPIDKSTNDLNNISSEGE